ncbi:MAG: NAD(P)-binding domain-containing protein [Candidatus Nomurabacteria bacterium]|nr:NAD(P)-binding domain-containing protein [Candidatus Nomurabacteria bacterium]
MYYPTIGFIGQGFIGKNYSDDFENRGFNVIRYSLEEAYIKNREFISTCDMVFIAVPTPTTTKGYDFSLVKSSLMLVGKGKIAVIKSTMLPGTTKKLQEEFKDIFVIHSPEFLREVSATFDATNPERNIIGIPHDTDEYKKIASIVLSVLPKAGFTKICSAQDAELIKYAGNNFLNIKVVYINILYDLAKKFDCDWNIISEAMVADPRIGSSHMNPIHDGGRGAGGHCFIKDFSAFRSLYEDVLPEEELSILVLSALEQKNINLLKGSGKNHDLLREVYGEEIFNGTKHE